MLLLLGSIEFHECKCQRIQWRFIIIIIKMHLGADKEFVRVNVSVSVVYRLQYRDKWKLDNIDA